MIILNLYLSETNVSRLSLSQEEQCDFFSCNVWHEVVILCLYLVHFISIKKHQRCTLGKRHHNSYIVSVTYIDSTGPFSRVSVKNDK